MGQASQGSEGASPAAAGGTVKPRPERVIKLAFVVVTLAVVAMLYGLQRRGLSLPGWGNDLPAALAQAAREGRPVLAFFVSSPPGYTSRELTKNTIPKNAQAIEHGRFITVVVKVSNLSRSEPANRYGITKLPTMLVIGPDGAEKNRREGFIGELEFRTGFLDCSQLLGPAATSRPR